MVQVRPLLDRRVPPEFLAELSSDGVFGWVAELAREPLEDRRPLDLGLRVGRDHVASAVLYVGTTQILTIERRPGGRYRLKGAVADGAFAPIEVPFESTWSGAQPLAGLRGSMTAVRRYVHAALDAAPDGHMVEGRLQAALAKASSAYWCVVDREVKYAWPDDSARRLGKSELRAPLERALADLRARYPGQRWPKAVTYEKFDALGYDSDGRLLAFEVKPGDVDTVRLTPMQVAAQWLFTSAWLASNADHAVDVVEGLAEQRQHLGLLEDRPPRLDRSCEVVPVIVLGPPGAPVGPKREEFDAVRQAVEDQGVSLAKLEIWTVDLDGEVHRPMRAAG